MREDKNLDELINALGKLPMRGTMLELSEAIDITLDARDAIDRLRAERNYLREHIKLLEARVHKLESNFSGSDHIQTVARQCPECYAKYGDIHPSSNCQHGIVERIMEL